SRPGARARVVAALVPGCVRAPPDRGEFARALARPGARARRGRGLGPRLAPPLRRAPARDGPGPRGRARSLRAALVRRARAAEPRLRAPLLRAARHAGEQCGPVPRSRALRAGARVL